MYTRPFSRAVTSSHIGAWHLSSQNAELCTSLAKIKCICLTHARVDCVLLIDSLCLFKIFSLNAQCVAFSCTVKRSSRKHLV